MNQKATRLAHHELRAGIVPRRVVRGGDGHRGVREVADCTMQADCQHVNVQKDEMHEAYL